jgi:nickel-dependent lactate racemase
VIVRLPYGRGALPVDLRGLRCHPLEPTAPRAGTDAAELAVAALDHPIAGPPLTQLASGRRRVTLLVPDATRKVELPAVLPVIGERLTAAGVPTAGITVLVACGTHPPAPAGELAALLGPLPDGVTVVQHDARDEASLVVAGTLPSGLTVRLHRALLQADLVVAVSTLAHHYFAGFTGGPKLVFPGVAGYEEIQRNHARVLDLDHDPPRRHPGCEPGRVAGNPVAEEIAAAAALRPPDVALAMIRGRDGRPVWMGAGPLDAVMAQGTALLRQWYEVTAPRFERLVVAAGGYPSDHTLIQAHKALDAACRFASPGAEVLFAAACDGGPGSPAMEPFLADPTPEAILARLGQRYVQYGHTTLRLVEKTARYRVAAVTQLPEELVRRLGMLPLGDPQRLLDGWRDAAPGAVVGVMVGAPVYPPA